VGFASWQRYCTVLQQWASAKLCSVEQRAPPIFGRAAITLGIGPYSSFLLCQHLITAAWHMLCILYSRQWKQLEKNISQALTAIVYEIWCWVISAIQLLLSLYEQLMLLQRVTQPLLVSQSVGNWTTRGYANSWTGHLADWSTSGLDSSRTSPLADWTTRGLADAAKRTKTKHAKSPVASASCPVRESSSPQVGISSSCPVISQFAFRLIVIKVKVWYVARGHVPQCFGGFFSFTFLPPGVSILWNIFGLLLMKSRMWNSLACSTFAAYVCLIE